MILARLKFNLIKKNNLLIYFHKQTRKNNFRKKNYLRGQASNEIYFICFTYFYIFKK